MKSIFALLLCNLVLLCKPPQIKYKPYPIYIYDSAQYLEKGQNSNDTLDYLVFRTHKIIYRYFDTILIATDSKNYYLQHYLKYNNYRDTFFIRSKNYLDSIKYVNSKWLENEINLDSLYKPIDCWRCGGIYDTSKIFLILRIDNTDSVIFRQVHRWYFQTN